MPRRTTRDRNEIIATILQSVQHKPVGRTKIMYNTSLNFEQTKEYLPILEDAELIKVVETDKKYTITEKGRRLLELYSKSKRLFSFR